MTEQEMYGMERMTKAILAGVAAIALLFGHIEAMTGASFTESEQSTDNALRCWDEPWYDTNWLYRREITIDHAEVSDVTDPSTTYADFAVLVYATGLSTDHMEPNGADIRFTKSDGTTEIPREIESCSEGTLWAWVKTTLTKDSSDSTDDAIYMYYGNPAATEPAPDSTYGSENVWDSDYRGVWHLNETSGTHHDSTSNDNDGTPQGGLTQNASGKVDGADDFDGSNDWVDVTKLEQDIGVTTGAIEIWINTDSAILSDGGGHAVVEIGDASDKNNWLGLRKTNSNGLDMRYRVSGTNYQATISDISGFGEVWKYVAGVWDASNLYIYEDGTLQDTSSRGGDINPSTLDQSFISADAQGAIDHYFNGIIDEVRVSGTARGPNWIQTSYNNQISPSSFCSVGAEE